MSARAQMHPDATEQQLLRAAAGLEAIAQTCVGTRRDELLGAASDLRARATARRWTERHRVLILQHAGLG